MEKQDVFKEYLKQLGVDITLHKKPLTSFRVLKENENTLDALKKKGFDFVALPDLDAYILTKQTDKKLSETEEFNSGKIYLQELSSVIPALELNITENDRIIDLCAAPGSKSIQILAANLKSHLTVVEKSRARFYKLQNNLTKYAIRKPDAIMCDARHILKIKPDFENTFDKVLADVPCTNESSVFTTEDLESWNQKNSKGIAKVQKGILNTAFKLLRPGGTLIYSTCTYAPEENEKVVDWLLKRNPEAALQKMHLSKENFSQGLTEWKGKQLNPELNKTLRILPNGQFKGFFIAKVTKM